MTTCPKCKHEFPTAAAVAGGKARWRNITRTERSEKMRQVAKARWAKKGTK